MHFPIKDYLRLHLHPERCGYTLLIFISVFLAAPEGRAAGWQTLTDHVPPVARQSPLGRLNPTNQLHLAIALPLRNQAALAELLQQIQDPASPSYHHYLTPQEFADQFGPSTNDYAAVRAFAGARGLHVTGTYTNRYLLDVSGSVPAVEQALHVTMHTYQHPTEHRTFFAPDTAPSLDLATPILAVSGLDNYELPHPRFVARPSASAQLAVGTYGSGPYGGYMGNDFRTAYVPDTTLTGTGQTVGLLQFDGYTAADITYYEAAAGRPSVPLQNVLLDGFNGEPTGSGGEVEVSLDIEMSLSMAPNLNKIIVYEAGPNGSWHDILNRMANDNLAAQMSCSWYIPGGAEDPVADGIFQEMAAQGQSFFCASGDDDAYTGLISFPSDSPYITLVGGTTLTTTGAGGPYVSETVWNWEDGIGSGGGISTQYPIPAWQTNISMTANQGSTTRRNVPDVALTADNVYVRADGENQTVGGTSCASPLWAGFTALVNSQAAAAGKRAVGFINPALDTIGKSAIYTTCFHDTTVGNDESDYSPSRFVAATGYDLCTGWGTPAGQNLINALVNPEPLVITPGTGFSASGGVGGPFTQTSQIFTLTNSGTNTLTWSLASTSAWLHVTSTGGTLASGATTTVTAVFGPAASTLGVGTYSNTLWFTNLSDQIGQSRVITLSIIQPPVITTQPTNVTVLEGEPASFSITATGGQPLAYQWRENGTNLVDGSGISGSTTSNLVFTSASASEEGIYTIVVTNAAGATRASAALTVPTSPPVFTVEPTNQTIYAGESVEFTAAVVGSKPYSFQWSFNSTAIPGATNATLTLSDLQLAQSGDYTVLATNAYGSTESAVAVLAVNPPPPCAPVSLGMVDWWAGEGNALDNVGTNNGTLIGGVTFGPGEVGQAFVLDGSSGYVSIPDSPSLDSFVTNITIELWLMVNQDTPNSDWTGIVTKGNTSWRLQGAPGRGTVDFASDGLGTDLDGNQNINDGQWHHVAAVYDGTNIYLYVDGALDASTPCTGLMAQNHEPVCLGENPEVPQHYYFNGSLDEATLYNRALSANEIQTIYIAGRGGKCPLPITISLQPTNETVNVGGTATFAVTATGAQPLSYQWNFNGTAIESATNSVLILDDVQATNDGTYTVTLTNPYQSVTSSAAILTVPTFPPSIISQPVSQTNYAGTTANFSVSAGGTQPLSYQWSFDGNGLDGATNAILSLPDVQSGEAGNYSVSISNPYGETNSVAVTLTVAPLPDCAPISESMVSWWTGQGNANDSFGTNNGTLVGGVSYTAGQVGEAFLLDGSSGYVSVPDSASLDSFVTNITIELWLMVNQTTPNSDWTGIVTKGNTSWRLQGTPGGGTIDFASDGLSTDLNGNQNINDGQWHHVAAVYDGTNIYLYVDGALDASVPCTGLMAQNHEPVCLGENPEVPQHYYFNGSLDEVTLYNRALSADEIQTIYLAGSGGKCSVPIEITTQPTNETVNAGSMATFTVAAIGSKPLTYEWNFDGTPITGATNDVFAIVAAQPSNAGVYTVTVSNPYQAVTSSNAVLSVATQPPVIVAQPVSQTNSIGETVFLSVTAIGTAPLRYQWKFNATNLAGATNALLTLTNIQVSQAGNYAVTVSNPYGTTNSAAALLTVSSTLPCDPAPSGLVNWWAGEGNANDSVGTNNGTLEGGVTYVAGEVGKAFLCNGSTGYVEIPDSPALDTFVSNITIECWIKVNQTTANADWRGIITKGNSSWRLQGTSGAGTIYFDSDGINIGLKGVRNVNDEKWHHVAATYNGSNICLYVDGTLDASAAASGSMLQDSYPVCLGANLNASNPYYFNGAIDEACLYNRALSAAEIQAIYAAGSEGKCPEPIVIVNQPTNETVNIGASANFTATATGSRPLTFQWNFNGAPIGGATNSIFAITNAQLSNSGDYSVTVANPYQSLTSSNALLTVVSLPPVILTQPVSQTNSTGTTASFDVVAAGKTPLTFQWSFGATKLAGATNSTLILTNLALNQTGNYMVLVTNAYGTVVSSNAMLVVTPQFHFVWNSIPTNRFLRTPFAVVVQAENVTNGIATNFTSTVFIASTNGISVVPTISGNFTEGVWTGAVTVAQLATNLVLQASDGLGDFGLANPINVVSLPTLSTLSSAGNLLMLWPVSPSGFQLQTTPRLLPANWIPVTTPPFQIGDQYLLTVPDSGTNAFYRLVFPGP